MDDGEVDFSNQDVFSTSNIGDLPGGGSMDSFLDEILKDTHACTHTHTCHPPGPDYSHTHTCFHVHTKIVSAPSEEKISTDDTAESSEKKPKKRPLGNREAVRKYREKKKARAASLEDEVERLRALNQQLMKRLQGQAALEAEIARLKCLLVDIRGRIEGEIGSFPYQRSARSGDIYQNAATLNFPGAYVMNPCNMQFDDQAHCRHPGMDGKSGEAGSLNGQGFSGCEFENLQCLGSQGAGLKELPNCGLGNMSSTVNSSGAKKRRVSPVCSSQRSLNLNGRNENGSH
ncbi:basic leucine zipper 23-like isoform X2 [Diospyros lotus]|uniref:basic leucine zipper 23-like isoform X2 n=1 Tax=Diospyros lotus TaxID=55363 RepID=UPI0022512039|nr:basic leucine zipper 23-like isoform X2 [Diospyros lotus]